MFAVVWTADCIAFFITFPVIASFPFLSLSHLGGHTGACSWRITVRLKRMLTRVELYVFSAELSSFPFEIIYSLFCASLWESIAFKETKRHVCFFHTAQYFILTSNFPWPPQQSFKSQLCLEKPIRTLKVKYRDSFLCLYLAEQFKWIKLLKDKGQFNRNKCPWNKEGTKGAILLVQPELRIPIIGFVAVWQC